MSNTSQCAWFTSENNCVAILLSRAALLRLFKAYPIIEKNLSHNFEDRLKWISSLNKWMAGWFSQLSRFGVSARVKKENSFNLQCAPSTISSSSLRLTNENSSSVRTTHLADMLAAIFGEKKSKKLKVFCLRLWEVCGYYSIRSSRTVRIRLYFSVQPRVLLIIALHTLYFHFHLESLPFSNIKRVVAVPFSWEDMGYLIWCYDFAI